MGFFMVFGVRFYRLCQVPLAMNGHRPVASLVATYIAAGQLVSPIQTIMYDTVDN